MELKAQCIITDIDFVQYANIILFNVNEWILDITQIRLDRSLFKRKVMIRPLSNVTVYTSFCEVGSVDDPAMSSACYFTYSLHDQRFGSVYSKIVKCALH